MKVVIVEDEKLAAERLQTLLKRYDDTIEVMACLESIEETVLYLKQHPHPDIMLLEIELSDGQSFEIFRQVQFNRPVIFITAHKQYALDAFKWMCIDYILKPVTLESLAAAINKLKLLSIAIAAPELNRLLPALGERHYKKRFLVRVGQRLFIIPAESVGFFQADNKIVYLVDKEGKRYVADHTMDELTELLDPREFFRLNRSFIVSINAIQQVKPYYNSRLKLSVQGFASSEEMVVSRDKVAEFKKWAEM